MVMSICREPRYRKFSPSANSSNVPRAAVHIGQAVLELRRRAAGELSGSISRELRGIADILHALIPRLEKFEQCAELERLAGDR